MNKGTPVETTHENLAAEMDAMYPRWAYRVRRLDRELDDKTNKVKHLNGILEVLRLGDPSVAQIIKLTEDRDRLQLENNALGKSLTYWQQRAFGVEDILKTIQDIGEAAHSVESLRNIARIAKKALLEPTLAAPDSVWIRGLEHDRDELLAALREARSVIYHNTIGPRIDAILTKHGKK